jgi:hypothetical protein
MSIGLDWWEEELGKMGLETLLRLKKITAQTYIQRLVNSLTIEEI